MGEAAVRAIDLATMGCTWVLDVSALDPDEADAMAHRWQRCVDLLAAPAPQGYGSPWGLEERDPAAPNRSPG